MSGGRNLTVLLTCCVLALGASACIKVDNSMGLSFVPDNERFFTRTITIPLDSMYVGYVDSMSAYNSQRFTIGAIRDNTFGLTRRTAAFSLIPFADSLHWGKNIRNLHVHFGAALDSVSYSREDQRRIIQNIHVYALKDINQFVDTSKRYSCEFTKAMFDVLKGKEVTDGIPAYNGNDSLSFDISADFWKKAYLVDSEGKSLEGRSQVVVNKIDEYKKTYPGIFLCVEDPENSEGAGRIEYFKTAPVITDNAYISGSFIEVSFTADYNGRQVDTAFFYTIGATGTKYESSTLFYAFNCCEHESLNWKKDGRYGKAETIAGKDLYLVSDKAVIEGGAGMKPMFRAENVRNVIKDSLTRVIRQYGLGEVEDVLAGRRIFINRATLILPYDFPEEYSKLNQFPTMLSPTVALRNTQKKLVNYAGLEDAGVTDENQGNIDYSNNCYRPDISYHLQEILGTRLDKSSPDYEKNRKKLRECDMWLFSLANETVTTIATQTSNDNYLAYLNYYYGMMNGDYVNNSYANYYNYSMMQAMYNSANNNGSSTTSVKVYTLDKDRYYNAALHGPYSDAGGTVHRGLKDSPRLVITYSFLLPETDRQ